MAIFESYSWLLDCFYFESCLVFDVEVVDDLLVLDDNLVGGVIPPKLTDDSIVHHVVIIATFGFLSD